MATDAESTKAAEVKELQAEWDRLTREFLPIQGQLTGGQAGGAEMERLIAERTRLVDALRVIGDRLEELGAVRN